MVRSLSGIDVLISRRGQWQPAPVDQAVSAMDWPFTCLFVQEWQFCFSHSIGLVRADQWSISVSMMWTVGGTTATSTLARVRVS